MRGRAVSGYSLIELLVVIAVLSILAMAAFPLAEMQVQRERERELKRSLWEIRDAIDAYKHASDAGEIQTGAQASGYPETLQTLVDGKPAEGAAGQRLYFLRRIPRDPFADPTLEAHQTWGLRSFQSSAQRPMPGADVYDVYSKAQGIGLNGTPLTQW